MKGTFDSDISFEDAEQQAKSEGYTPIRSYMRGNKYIVKAIYSD